jgi:hypothetical protein
VRPFFGGPFARPVADLDLGVLLVDARAHETQRKVPELAEAQARTPRDAHHEATPRGDLLARGQRDLLLDAEVVPLRIEILVLARARSALDATPTQGLSGRISSSIACAKTPDTIVKAFCTVLRSSGASPCLRFFLRRVLTKRPISRVGDVLDGPVRERARHDVRFPDRSVLRRRAVARFLAQVKDRFAVRREHVRGRDDAVLPEDLLDRVVKDFPRVRFGRVNAQGFAFPVQRETGPRPAVREDRHPSRASLAAQ